MTEMRCGACRAIAVECPLGYYGGVVHCDVCGYRFELKAPNCAPRIHCPECRGTVTYEAEP